MRWPWQRRDDGNGEAAAAARDEAQERLQQAREGTVRVDRTASQGRAEARKVDWFVAEVERSMRLRGL